MKKKLFPALGLLAVSALASCGGGNGSVDVFIYQYSDTYINSVRTALDTDLKAASINATFYDGQGVQATQTQQIETALASGSKLLIANLVEQTASGASIA